MRIRLRRLVRLNSTTLGLLLTGIVLLLAQWAPVPLQRLELLASDARLRVRGERTPGSEVVIAAIDEKSIDALGALGRWPYSVHAQLVDRLVEYGAKAIGYDVVFDSSDVSGGLQGLQDVKAQLMHNSQLDPMQILVLDQAITEANYDQRFAEALRRSGRTVLGYFFHWRADDVRHLDEQEIDSFRQWISGSEYGDHTLQDEVHLRDLPLKKALAVESNIRPLAEAAWGSGFFNSLPDSADGTIRRYPLVVQYRDELAAPKTSRRAREAVFPPLGIRLLERYLEGIATFEGRREGRVPRVTRVSIWSQSGDRYDIPTDPQGRMLVNYLGPSERRGVAANTSKFTFPRYSVVDIIQGNNAAIPAGALQNKIVLIGATAVALADLRTTPLDTAFPGVEIHATIIDNVLRRQFLVEPWWAPLYTLGAIIVIGVCLTLTLPRLGALRGDVIVLLLIAGSLVFNYGLFAGRGLVLNIIYPLLTTAVVWMGMTIYHYVVEQRDQRFLRKTFATYLSPALVEQMVQSRTPPRLGGSLGTRTAYFTDIASFSSFSEVLTATQLVELLNEYLTAMTDILLLEGGTLDKYEGDAIVAFFGAPLPQPDHASRALRTALGMQAELARLRQKWQDEAAKWPELVKQMRMRIGICSGDIVTGNMGSATRMNYTMMGDVVNTAARLEASAKQYGIYIHCAMETLRYVDPQAFEWRIIDRVKVVGKEIPVETLELMALKGQLSVEQEQMRAIYQQGVELYRQQKWDEAKARFLESDKLEEMFPRRPTNPSRVYSERCDFFKENPPAEDWDGSWTLTSK